MKRYFLVAVGVLAWVPLVRAQSMQDNGPAQAPVQSVEMQADGHCRTVHPGDTVHFSLTLEGAENARAVFADLRLGTGHAVYRETDLPLPGAGDMGGGGAGTRDGGSGKLYHFAFTVPAGVGSGVYRAAGVAVTVNYGGADKPVEADIDRHAREQVRHFCLAVFGSSENAPVVTDFHPEGVDRK